jgi:hypothetical protein
MTPATKDWLSELVTKVEQYAKDHPPPPILEGPGFVMIGGAYEPKAKPKSEGFTWAQILQLVLIIGLISGCTVLALARLILPSIVANL